MISTGFNLGNFLEGFSGLGFGKSGANDNGQTFGNLLGSAMSGKDVKFQASYKQVSIKAEYTTEELSTLRGISKLSDLTAGEAQKLAGIVEKLGLASGKAGKSGKSGKGGLAGLHEAKGKVIIEQLKQYFKGQGVPLEDLEVNLDGLKALKNFLINSGFDKKKVNEIFEELEGIAEGDNVKLSDLFFSLSKLEDAKPNEDAPFYLSIASLPYIETILGDFGFDDGMIEQAMSGVNIKDKGLDIKKLTENIREIHGKNKGLMNHMVDGKTQERIWDNMSRAGLGVRETGVMSVERFVHVVEMEVSVRMEFKTAEELNMKVNSKGLIARGELFAEKVAAKKGFNIDKLLAAMEEDPELSDRLIKALDSEQPEKGIKNLLKDAGIKAGKEIEAELLGETEKTAPTLANAKDSKPAKNLLDFIGNVEKSEKAQANTQITTEGGLADAVLKDKVAAVTERGAAVDIKQSLRKDTNETDFSLMKGKEKNNPQKQVIAPDTEMGKNGENFKDRLAEHLGTKNSGENSQAPVREGSENFELKGEAGRTKAGDAIIQGAENDKGHTADRGTALKSGSQSGRTLPAYVMNQVSRKMSVAIKNNDNELKLQLKPPHLGRIQMSIENAKDGVKVSIMTEQHAAKEMLSASVAELKSTLTEQGLKVDKIDVQLSQDFEQSMNQARQENQQNRSRQGHGHGNAAGGTADAGDGAEIAKSRNEDANIYLVA